jgi:hypothetical protein
MPTVGILLAGAIILLGAATANVSNLILTRTWLRRRELSTRVALGAGVRDAITHVLLENVLFGVATALLSLPCAYLGIIAVRRFAPGGLPGLERLEFDGALGIYTCGLALAAAVIGSVAPSVAVARLGRSVPIAWGATTDRSLRPRVLVCLQVGLSTVVLAYALVLLGAYVRVQSKTYGFDTRNRIGAEVSLPAFNCAPECQQLVCASAVLELGQLGKVENVALADRVPGGRKPLKSLWCERLDAYSGPARGDVSGLCAVTSVSSLYFRTLGLGMMAGRPFSDGEAAPVVVVNDVVARRMWSVESAVGKRLRLTDERDREVVGVVPSVEEPGLMGVERYQVYVPVQQSSLLAGETVGVLIHSTETGSEFVDSVRRRLAGVDQRLIIDRIATMDDMLAASTSTVRLQAMGIGVFGVGVLLLAAGGIHSTTAFVTAQQSREMAIRSAIGARRRDLLMGPMRFALGTAAIGWAVGLVTLPATHVLASRLGLPDTESGMLVVGATLVISAATVVAAGMSAGRRATTVDPARLLRE